LNINFVADTIKIDSKKGEKITILLNPQVS